MNRTQMVLLVHSKGNKYDIEKFSFFKPVVNATGFGKNGG